MPNIAVVVSFDLHAAEPEDYEPAPEALATVGLHPRSTNKGFALPASTVMGNVNVGSGAWAR